MKKNDFFQIGYVCQTTELTHATIRFWEKQFELLQPHRSAGGHRYYDQSQIDLLLYLKKLLHEEGLTIEGAKKRIEAEDAAQSDLSQIAPLKALRVELDREMIKNELLAILHILNK